METNPNPDLELVHVAIQRLLEDKKEEEEEEQKRKRPPQASGDLVSFDGDGDGDGDHLLLSKLLSQVESLKASRAIKKPEASADTGVAVNEVKAKSDATVGAAEPEAEEGKGGGQMEATPEEIVRELRKVKRQNTVTHWLLSAMIVLTLAWQLSEVSLILKVREGLSHPFRSIGSTITDFFKGPAVKGRDDMDKDADRRQSETIGIPPLQMPEVPHFDVPDLIPNGENHSPASV
ncbi:uncharacterized protein LOC115749436 [Rhodamnia argentea]|uniref:Uncharacterized protein LOC115749436 n=1 Tax=Rhodamnia argentea TaxID=178133 RepID=A0A8B8Q4X2_9MYRT|nr:uncharacterized protein LOC115749436 [Rhodamnia argentea]